MLPRLFKAMLKIKVSSCSESRKLCYLSQNEPEFSNKILKNFWHVKLISYLQIANNLKFSEKSNKEFGKDVQARCS